MIPESLLKDPEATLAALLAMRQPRPVKAPSKRRMPPLPPPTDDLANVRVAVIEVADPAAN